MRIVLLVLVLTLTCAPAFAQMNSSDMSNQNMSQPGGAGAGTCMSAATSATTGEEVMNTCVMRCYGLSQQMVNTLRAQGLTNQDIAMASAISARTNTPLSQVVTEWQNANKDWTTVARAHNLSMSDLTSMPTMTSSDEETFNQSFIANYYGIPSSAITSLRNQGYSWSEINMMANASARTGASIQQIASMRAQGMSWNDIAQRYNMTANQLLAPVATRQVAVSTMPTGVMVPAGAGPMVPGNIFDESGNIILTQSMAFQLYASGYDWMDVAIAANIARNSRVPIREVLTELNTGQTWPQIVSSYGMAPECAFNVCDYPFPRRSIFSASVEAANLRAIQAWQPCAQPCAPCVPAPVCPPPCPAPAPCPTGTTPALTVPAAPVTPAPAGAGGAVY